MTKFRLDRFLLQVQGVVSPGSVVDRIHRDFDSANEVALAEAEAFLEKCKNVPQEKADNLVSVGFVKSKEVTRIKESADTLKLRQKTAELISKYRVEYPNYKFILPQQVDEICDKYGLVLGKVGDFTGFVPEKNLQDIVRFKKAFTDNSWVLYNLFTDSNVDVIDMSNYEIRRNGDYEHFYWIGEGDDPSGRTKHFQRNVGEAGFYADGIIDGRRIDLTVSSHRLTEPSLMICGPLKDFDMKGKRVVGNRLLNIPDPVVLCPVEGGFIIVTAWGDEASDPIVVNQEMN